MAHRHDHCSISGCDRPGGVMVHITPDEVRYFCLRCGGIVLATLSIMERRIQEQDTGDE